MGKTRGLRNLKFFFFASDSNGVVLMIFGHFLPKKRISRPLYVQDSCQFSYAIHYKSASPLPCGSRFVSMLKFGAELCKKFMATSKE